jgi:hypothetical protein
MSYDTFTSTKECELCKDAFQTKNIRTARLCPNCEFIEVDANRVLNGKSYSLATEEEKRDILERAKSKKTLASGPFFNRKDPNGTLGIQNEYQDRFKQGRK